MDRSPRARRLFSKLVLAFATASMLPAGAAAQEYPRVDVGGRIQFQYAHSSVESATNDFLFRRVRLRADLAVNEWIVGRIQPEFAGGGASLQDAYMSFLFSDAFVVSAGQFKRTFDLFDLSSATRLSLIERDGRVEGAGDCPGVGGVCSHNRLTEQLEFSGRDLGVSVEGSVGAIGYSAMIANGEGTNASDVNDAKSFFSRISLAATEDLVISGKVGVHDYLDPAGDVAHAPAFGAELEYGTWQDSFHAQASFITGENWQLLRPGGEPADFRAVEAWATYYQPVEGDRVVAVEPLLRIGFADADTDSADDAGTIVTPGLMFYFGGRNKLGANLDIYSPQTGPSEYSLKLQTFLYF